MSKLRPRKGKSLTWSHTAVSGRSRIRFKTGDSKSSAPTPHTACSLTGHTLADRDTPVSQEWGSPSPPTGAPRLSGLIDTKNVSSKGTHITSTFLQGTFFSGYRGTSQPGTGPQSPGQTRGAHALRLAGAGPQNQLASGFWMSLITTHSNAFCTAAPYLSWACLPTCLSFMNT